MNQATCSCGAEFAQRSPQHINCPECMRLNRRAAQAKWFAKNPGYKTQWQRDTRVYVSKRQRKGSFEKQTD